MRVLWVFVDGDNSTAVLEGKHLFDMYYLVWAAFYAMCRGQEFKDGTTSILIEGKVFDDLPHSLVGERDSILKLLFDGRPLYASKIDLKVANDDSHCENDLEWASLWDFAAGYLVMASLINCKIHGFIAKSLMDSSYHALMILPRQQFHMNCKSFAHRNLCPNERIINSDMIFSSTELPEAGHLGC